MGNQIEDFMLDLFSPICVQKSYVRIFGAEQAIWLSHATDSRSHAVECPKYNGEIMYTKDDFFLYGKGSGCFSKTKEENLKKELAKEGLAEFITFNGDVFCRLNLDKIAEMIEKEFGFGAQNTPNGDKNE